MSRVVLTIDRHTAIHIGPRTTHPAAIHTRISRQPTRIAILTHLRTTHTVVMDMATMDTPAMPTQVHHMVLTIRITPTILPYKSTCLPYRIRTRLRLLRLVRMLQVIQIRTKNKMRIRLTKVILFSLLFWA